RGQMRADRGAARGQRASEQILAGRVFRLCPGAGAFEDGARSAGQRGEGDERSKEGLRGVAHGAAALQTACQRKGGKHLRPARRVCQSCVSTVAEPEEDGTLRAELRAG